MWLQQLRKQPTVRHEYYDVLPNYSARNTHSNEMGIAGSHQHLINVINQVKAKNSSLGNGLIALGDI
ncbi:uncharacterized protein PHALS_06819 [Plasmopara halstedii]|uniref:Uncharacterized protein n=1 Tax=Plasmopara halstedii TaxID=4781 RepID=A0A0P1B3W8_PLAHL|nr:uncharacterized protein PHALS_06819 [Plasmopara halstedii]CEG49029.1 hypothetical protein PHALS_06819 [Plasmopara halstedii]|eukprot:XP_024585398.1 hypothetical protein PHALS_06819 [Plasmopara halstedii]